MSSKIGSNRLLRRSNVFIFGDEKLAHAKFREGG
jgi:hypothetical protein